MIFTREQFDDRFKDFYLDDFPGLWTDDEWRFNLFNSLPNNIQATALAWGCNDTVFVDNAFEFLVKRDYGMIVDEFYELQEKCIHSSIA